MSLARLALLGAIDRLAGEATPSQLAPSERFRSSQSSCAFAHLEADALIEHQADAHDRRKTRVRLIIRSHAALSGERMRREEWLAAVVSTCLNRTEQQLLVDAGALLERIANFEHPSSNPSQKESV